MGVKIDYFIMNQREQIFNDIMLSKSNESSIDSTTRYSRKPSMVEHSNVQQIKTGHAAINNMYSHAATRRRRRRSSMEPMHKRRASSVSCVGNGSAPGTLSITPSLSSILNQRKSQKTNSESKKKTNYHYYHHVKRHTDTCPIKKSQQDQPHPLNDTITPRYCGLRDFKASNVTEAQIQTDQPQVEIFNDLQDLDLYTEMTLNDVVQFYSPVQTYTNTETESLQQETCTSLSSVPNHTDSIEDDQSEKHIPCIELDNIPTQKPLEQPVLSSSTPQTGKLGQLHNITYPKQQRHQSLSPHFMLLYSMEQNMKKTQLLPELDVDEVLLAKLSVQDIWNLEIPKPQNPSAATIEGCKSIADANTSSPNISDCSTAKASASNEGSSKCAWNEEDNIKLALITRKKLWCDMIQNSRVDTFGGENLPWNKKFVYNAVGSSASDKEGLTTNDCTIDGGKRASQKKVQSLVRLNSRKAPWMHVTDSSFSSSTPTPAANTTSQKVAEKLSKASTRQMIKPCGLLDSGRIQYVVKGWCDSRFLS